MPNLPAGSISSWRLTPVSTKPVKPRQRSFRPKTRSGCITCKARRVKCDEERPHCARCIKGGFPCEGYTPTKTWLFEPTTATSATPQSTHGSSSESESGELIISPSWADAVDSSEQRALSYWMERTQPELVAFTYATAHFWTNLVPQMFQNNPTVRSAVVAAAALHEDTRLHALPSQKAARNNIYVKHYFRAVRDLTNTDSPPSREVILMSCLIFLTCENLRESAPGVILHLKAGLKVLREWRKSQPVSTSSAADSSSDLLFNSLEPLFARLEAQASMIPNFATESLDFRAYDLHWKRPVLPKKFNTFFEARNGIHDIIQHMWYQYMQSTGHITTTSASYRDFLYNMTAWNVVFMTSFPLYDDPTWPYHKAATTMRLHQKALVLVFKSEASQDSLWMDQHEEEVKYIIDAAEDIIITGKPHTDLSKYGFSNIWEYDFCLGPPLLVLAMHCRHPLLRRRAIHLMRLLHCWWSEEDSYTACTTARTCELIMDVEERDHPIPIHATSASLSTSAHIPPSRRIRVLYSHLDRPGKIAIEYSRPPHTPDDVSTAEVDWPLWGPPPIPFVRMYPFAEMVKHGNSLGLIRPIRNHCLCQSLGTPVKKMWENPA